MSDSGVGCASGVPVINRTASSGKRGRPRSRSKPNSPYRKLGAGIPIRGQSRELVCRVREYFQREKENGGPLLPLKEVVKRTSDAVGINKSTVVSIGLEKKKCIEVGSGLLSTPNKKRIHKSSVTCLDPFDQDGIRRHIYSYVLRKEHPTLKKLVLSLKEAELFKGSRSSLYRLLKKLGFGYKQLNKRKVLFERQDIIAKRCKFLRDVKNLDFDNIVWLDETWVNTGHTVAKCWTDHSLEGTMAIPVGKGERIILLHAGDTRGFIPHCLLLFSSKKSVDYHEEMNHEVFYKWFKECLIPNIKTNSIIIMDNASYHSKLLDKAPTMSTLKSDIIDWLRQHSIGFDPEMKKAELMEIVNLHKPQISLYVVDELAKLHGHKVIRLPPYHCHFNSIELIWAQIKSYVAKNNKKFNLTEIKNLTLEAINQITDIQWTNVVKHTKKVILDAWDREGLLEEAVEQMIISVNDSDSSEDDWELEEGERMEQPAPREQFDESRIYLVDDMQSDENQDEDLTGFSPLPPTEEKVINFVDY